jgi:ribosomal protein S1
MDECEALIEHSEANDLENRFPVGQKVTVQLLKFNVCKRYWEVSARAVQLRERWQERFPLSSKVIGKIIRLGHFGALVELAPGFVGRVSRLFTTGLAEADLLEVGQKLAAKIGEWDGTGIGPFLVPLCSVRARGQIRSIEYWVNPSGVRLHYMIAVEVGEGRLVWCDARLLVAAKERYQPGAEVAVCIDLGTYQNGVFQGEIVPSEAETARYGRAPAVGTVVEGVAVEISKEGTVCKVADRVLGVVHPDRRRRQSMRGFGLEVGPGDRLRVRVLRRARSGAQFKLLSVEERFAA